VRLYVDVIPVARLATVCEAPRALRAPSALPQRRAEPLGRGEQPHAFGPYRPLDDGRQPTVTFGRAGRRSPRRGASHRSTNRRSTPLSCCSSASRATSVWRYVRQATPPGFGAGAHRHDVIGGHVCVALVGQRDRPRRSMVCLQQCECLGASAGRRDGHQRHTRTCGQRPLDRCQLGDSP
jgi:hypothetical protein